MKWWRFLLLITEDGRLDEHIMSWEKAETGQKAVRDYASKFLPATVKIEVVYVYSV